MYYLQEQAPELTEIRSCNTIIKRNNKWIGYNTDISGFKKGSKSLKELVDKVNNNIFSICLDIGHANCYSNQSLEEIIKLLGNRIGHLHLSNNDGKKDSHCGFNNGNIDVINTLNLIDKYCDNPSMTIEVTSFIEAIESIGIIMERNK